MSRGDGDGWSRGSAGARRWGRYGAAGLLLRAPAEHGPMVLLQHRAFWSHHGGT
ncbi:MAG: NUDIX hydrolase, partial [Mycobacteriaceae bacterium]